MDETDRDRLTEQGLLLMLWMGQTYGAGSTTDAMDETDRDRLTEQGLLLMLWMRQIGTDLRSRVYY